ncbi:Ig-like domain-containing protein [Bacteriovorax sp. Seq25_V]|uniref:tandem-95 repeat protein n=1 Tax=Bacteriovorax sp. Seq25_V TaxID=1201288 RepID=UPI00054DC304|nr:Ig-like domain-containing protein [Bacteriovorax sp. Seq25_V]
MVSYFKYSLFGLTIVAVSIAVKYNLDNSIEPVNITPSSTYSFNKGKAASKKVVSNSTSDSRATKREPSSISQSVSNRNFNNTQPDSDTKRNYSAKRTEEDNDNYYGEVRSNPFSTASSNTNNSFSSNNSLQRSPSAYYDQADGTLSNIQESSNSVNTGDSATQSEASALTGAGSIASDLSSPSSSQNSSANSSSDESTSSSSEGSSSGSSSRTDPIEVASTPMIKGSVPPLNGIIASRTKSFFINEAYSASTCTSPKITIFDIKTMTPLADNPITIESLSSTTRFEFNPAVFDLDLSKPTKYLLKTSGCDVNYERIITSYYTDQNLTPTSTLVSKIIKTSATVDIENIEGTKVEAIITEVDNRINPTDDFEVSYSEVENDSAIQNKFSDAFEGEPYSILADSAPDITNLIIPSVLQEKVASSFIVNTQHWSSSYTTAFEWHADNVKKSNLATWNYSPSANSKRAETIKLYIGKAVSGAGSDVDRNFPYHELTYNITISDDIATTAPNISLNASSTNPTPTANINIDLSTGTDQGSYYTNCESFSSFAITENNDIPSNSDFTYSCTTANIQTIPYTLTNSNGDIDINIWAKDINGNISAKKSFTINYDTAGPVINFVGVPSSARADTLFTLSWTVSESNQTSSNQHSIEYYNGSTWVSLPAVSSADGVLNNQSFSTTYTLPNIATTNGKFRVSLTDSIGNNTIQETSQIDIQRPILGFSPSSLDFGGVLNSSTPSATALTILNTGNTATKDCSPPSLSGTNSSEFEITTDGCASSTLAAGSNCQVSVRPKPVTKGAKSSTLTWTCGLDSASINLSFTSTNNSPISPSDYAISTNEDTPLNFTATAGTDIDSDPVTYSIVTAPSNGTLTNCMSSDNDLSCLYTPDLNFNGTDSFTYKTNDGFSDSATTTVVTINIAAVNDAPTLSSTQTVGVIEDTAQNFSLNLGSDIDGDTLTYIITQNPAAGTLSCTGGTSNACTYSPASNDINTYTFKYKVNDGALDSSEATVTLNISNTNDAPTMLADQSVSTNEDTLVSFTLNGGSDIDIPSQTLSYKIVSAPTNGALTNCITTGSYSTDVTCDYTPNANFFGTDSFTYRVNDGIVDSATYSTVTINIAPVNDAPTLTTPQSFATNEDTVLNFNLATGSDIEGNALTYTKLTNPASGTLTCTGGTSTACTYTPATNYNGSVSFTYKVNDGSLDSNTATVNITVNSVNDAPTLDDATVFCDK